MSINLPARRLVSQEDSALIESPQFPRSRFVGAWTRKMAFDAGYLVPFLVEEVLPGDHLSYEVTAYIRLATPLFPLFDNQRVDTFFFFVPNRIVWANWVKFMGEQASGPGDSIAYTVPTILSPGGGFAENSIYDHMGIPGSGQIGAGQNIAINALPLRAYKLIFNQWFRDQNVMTSAPPPTGDGPDAENLYVLKVRAKSHDYFTTALPWPQKFTAPTVPVGGLAPVLGIGAVTQPAGSSVLTTVYEANQAARQYQDSKQLWDAAANNQVLVKQTALNGYPDVYADLSLATGVAINTFRQAFLIQGLLERDARGGTRYVELLKAHFGVTSPDFRLQRPEYIGGGQSSLNITPVAQTAPATGSVVGQLGGAGTAVGQHRASYAATEHGFIIGLINVRTELSYQQGLHKMWTRSTRYDYYWPALAGLGEQSVLRKELYCTGVSVDDNTVFGYQERWHEYRTRTSEVTGKMRSTATGTLDAWHLAQRFTAAPLLNDVFLSDAPPMSRVLAAGALAANQQYLADILIQRNAVRPVPMYGTPVQLGRF